MNLSRFFSWFFGRFFSIELGPSFPGRPIFTQFVPGVEFDAVGEQSVEHLGEQVGDVEPRHVELAVLDRLRHHAIHG